MKCSLISDEKKKSKYVLRQDLPYLDVSLQCGSD